jgi:hypothetical protein
MDTLDKLAGILQVKRETLESLGHKDALERVWAQNEANLARVLKVLGREEFDQEAARRLRSLALEHDAELKRFVDGMPGDNDFDKAAALARQVAQVGKGYFLKKQFGADILRKRPPQHLMEFFHYASVEDLLAKHELTEIFSALRFMESDEWMHETFEEAYSNFTPADFEEREIELKVLGPEWHEVAKKYVEKKHHNVSHLKEFGVIFLNPIAEDMPGKFLRDFALLFHYFHEVEFYSKMFRKYAGEPNFTDNFKMLLRGDVKDAGVLKPGEWLIVQRYFWKLDAHDPRLFIPRVNPESLHWRRGEMDIAKYAQEHGLSLALWEDLDWVGTNGAPAGLRHQLAEVLSLDLEDNAMAGVSLHEGKNEFLNYHEREAIWLRIFSEIVGGEDELERLVMENFREGVIRL